MMQILGPLLLFALGVVLVIKGGDMFVDAARWISDVTGVPRFIIGATVVSLATTMPELFVSLMATMQGSVDMAIGNAVGSVSANLGLIMGLSLVMMPARVEDGGFWEKAVLMTGSTMVLWALCRDGRLTTAEGVLLLSLMGLFVWTNLRSCRAAAAQEAGEARRDRPSRRLVALNAVKFLLGTAGIVVGARLLVNNGSALARVMGVPESVIGLTLVAVGTSLPELITTLTAIAKREASLSVGNIIGANTIDITLILAGCSFVSGGSLTVGAQAIGLDIPFSLLLMALSVLPPLFTKRFYRLQGIVLLLCYGGYITAITTGLLS